MKQLISLQEAQKLVANSDERKESIIELMNAEIKSQSERGLRWAHIPSTLNGAEKEFIKDELVLKGFTVNGGNPAVTW